MGTGITDAELAEVRRGDRLAAESIQRLLAGGVDPLAVIAERAKQDGIAAFASVRMNAYMTPPWDAVFNGSFWKRNRDKCILSPQGWSYANLSYAYPEVRKWYLDVVTETAERDIMGVNLDFLRHPPFFGVEKPLVDGYGARYGQAPPADPTWWAGTLTPEVLAQHKECEAWWRYRAELMTDLMRRIRAKLDTAEQRLGHPIHVSVRIDHRYYLPQGLDIETWIKEGLIDVLIVSQETAGGFEIDLAPFRKMIEGTNCKLIFGEETTLAGHDLTPEEDRALARGEKLQVESRLMMTPELAKRALKWYAEGADGIQTFNGPAEDDALRILGSVAKVKAYLARHTAP